ncbi:DUF1778 domain-containing protein [Pseudomonas jilinensis]|uniref:DUF1778 domain-containing protein n=1 Tax=Pseudomonas jilinensis TaxID=2078689 RepID=A0A396RSD8_9PSED|nr:DUF1778 domain-containing protein [Pseudomonas jilinensis]RHW19564.1 hypothetical protein C2846_18110 [Pseudomonas jilinensis]
MIPNNSKSEHLVTLEMDVEAKTLAAIEHAARLLGLSREEFILAVAIEKATDTLLDRRIFTLSETDFDAFEQSLNSPDPSRDEKLSKLLTRPHRWS